MGYNDLPDHPEIAMAIRTGYPHDYAEDEEETMPDGWEPSYAELLDYANDKGDLVEFLQDTLKEVDGINWTLYDILCNIQLNYSSEEVWNFLKEK